MVTPVFGDVVLINVISPNRIERGDIAGHTGHKARQQRRHPDSQQPSRVIVQEHYGQNHVVISFNLPWNDEQRRQPGHNSQNRKKHLRKGRNERCFLCGIQILRSQCPLNDDEVC